MLIQLPPPFSSAGVARPTGHKVSFDIERNRRVKAGTPDQTWQRGQRQAFTPAVILFISLPPAEDKSDPG